MQQQYTESELQGIWHEYLHHHSPEAKRKLMFNYVWVVRYVLSRMNLPSHSILNEDDFLHIGILGLNEAIERFEAERGIKFETFAVPRIRGIVLDEMRRLDWLSRSARKKVHELMEAADSLRSSTGREVSAEEIRQKLNVSHEEYQSYLAAAAAALSSLSKNDMRNPGNEDEEDPNSVQEVADPGWESPLVKMGNEEQTEYINRYLHNLPERKRTVMTLYYYENLTFKEIGELLEVTESRICQIHGQVVQDLRHKLRVFSYA
jgi:RNA polymerase sigma factor for flagellar operon FliA